MHRPAGLRGRDCETLQIVAYDHAAADAHAELLAAVRAQRRPRGAHNLIIAAGGLASSRIITADKGAFSDVPGVVTELHRVLS